MVIFNHIRSRISKPESGAAMALTMVSIGEFTVNFISSYGLSDSGMLDVMEELVDVKVLTDGGRPGNSPGIPLHACVCATHAPGSMGRTGSVRGMVK